MEIKKIKAKVVFCPYCGNAQYFIPLNNKSDVVACEDCLKEWDINEFKDEPAPY